ncbi:diguanylate cyclase domain-containing protein, partial [Robinsoniella sp. RHS]
MEKRLRNRRILDIVLIILVIAAAGILFAKLFYNSSQKKVLSNLAEISNQSAKVFQREAEKGKDIISNLAILLGQHDTCDTDELIQEIKAVDESNDFKRMGIIMPDGTAYTTDGVIMDLDGRDYFKRSMDGSVIMSDTLKDVEGGDKINVYSAPVSFRDGFRCVLFATLETDNFKSALAETIYSGDGYSYIIRGNGDYIVGEGAGHKEKQFANIYNFMEERSGKNSTAVKELKRGVSKGENGYVVFQDDMQYYMYYQPLSVNQWFLLTVVPGKVIKQSMGEILTLAYLFIFFCSCLIIILILQINRIRQVSRKDLEKIAFTDEATGMTNFNKFKVEAKQILEDNNDQEYTVVCFNIHKFQYINDLFGYAEGDRALTYVAGVIQENLRDKEAFARMLADHFVALLQQKDKKELKSRVENIIAQLQSKTDFGGKHYEIKATAGIYQIEPGVDEIDTMVDRAKMALNRPEGDLLQVCGYYDDKM